MKCQSQNEQEMRKDHDPTPSSIEELSEYIGSLVNRSHDYGTCVYAMSLAATAAFNYVAGNLGVTGFQASCADLDIVRRTRRINGPFILLQAKDMCYPQYDLTRKLQEAMDGWKEWASKECEKLLEESPNAHPDVIAHWKMMAGKQ